MYHSALTAAELHDNKTQITQEYISDVTVAFSRYTWAPEGYFGLVRIVGILQGAIATADESITLKDAVSTSTFATLLLAYTGSAAGTMFENTYSTPVYTAHNELLLGGAGASTGTVGCNFFMVWAKD